jgi:hypothetical protein
MPTPRCVIEAAVQFGVVMIQIYIFGVGERRGTSYSEEEEEDLFFFGFANFFPPPALLPG